MSRPSDPHRREGGGLGDLSSSTANVLICRGEGGYARPALTRKAWLHGPCADLGLWQVTRTTTGTPWPRRETAATGPGGPGSPKS